MDRGLIAEAIKYVELVDIRFNSGSLVRDDSFSDGSDNEDIVQQTRLSVSAQMLESSESPAEKSLARVKVEFGARYVQENSESNEDVEDSEFLAEVIAEFVALYLVKKGVEQEALQEFFKYNVVHNVWPFWREHLLRVTSSAGLPRFVVPLNADLLNDDSDG